MAPCLQTDGVRQILLPAVGYRPLANIWVGACRVGVSVAVVQVLLIRALVITSAKPGIRKQENIRKMENLSFIQFSSDIARFAACARARTRIVSVGKAIRWPVVRRGRRVLTKAWHLAAGSPLQLITDRALSEQSANRIQAFH